MTVSINRQIGSVFMVIGTEVGAGILALPILIAHMGFPLGCAIMFITWSLMTYTALLICEIDLAVEGEVSFAGMAKALLGFPGQAIVWLSFLVLLYTIMVAYISAAGSAFNTVFPIENHLIAFIFVAVLGTFVVAGTVAVDWINRLLLTTKLTFLLFVCVILLPKISYANLTGLYFNKIEILATIPVFVTSFTSHLIIPPLRTYLKSDVKAIVRVILIGSTIPLILYIAWIMGVLGVIPHTGDDSFTHMFATVKHANVGDILNLMKANLHEAIFYTPVAWFSNISVTTSFLGVSLALYYFLIDGLRLERLPRVSKNIIATVLTFALPLLIIWFFPNVFILALGYVGLCCSVLLIVMPFFMMRKLKQQKHKFKIKYIDNNLFLYVSLIMGVVAICIQLFIKI